MWKNKKGAALMQVLLMTMILAGMATMLLRASLSRTISARKTRRTVSATVLIEACMAEVNAIWSAKTADAYMRDLEKGWIYCSELDSTDKTKCAAGKEVTEYKCTIANPYKSQDGYDYEVTAKFDANKSLVYTVTKGSDLL